MERAVDAGMTDTSRLPVSEPAPHHSKISFSEDCFIEDGTRTEWVVLPNRGSAGYPQRFSDEAKAREFARVRRAEVVESTKPHSRRIYWY